MSKYEMLTKDVLTEVERILYELDVALENDKTSFVNSYKKQVFSLFDALNNQQNTSDKQQSDNTDNTINDIGTIMFMLSRINIENGLLAYKVKIYGYKIYVDNYDFNFSFDVSNVLKYFAETKKKLTANLKNYLGIIEPCNISAEINRYIPYFNMYIVNLLRDVFDDEETQKAMQKIKTFEDFYVIQSEIYEKPYLLYHSSNKILRAESGKRIV